MRGLKRRNAWRRMYATIPGPKVTGFKNSRPNKCVQVDMDKLADGLQRLGEDDLLQVVQMVHDNKAPDSYTKNDIERAFPTPKLPKNGKLITRRGRIPRGPIYPPRQPHQDALGLYTRKGCSMR